VIARPRERFVLVEAFAEPGEQAGPFAEEVGIDVQSEEGGQVVGGAADLVEEGAVKASPATFRSGPGRSSFVRGAARSSDVLVRRSGRSLP